jgi:hypothetical protein
MQRVLETLFSTFVYRGLGPALPAILMVAPTKKFARAQLKKIYVLNEMGDMTGEYVLDPECPIDYNDFLKVLPDEGIGDREALFVGEYVFTAFQSGKFVFVLLSRGQLAADDINWTALLLTAADAHLAAAASGAAPHAPETPSISTNAEKALGERVARLDTREKELAKLEVQLKADDANLKGRSDELERQKASLTALADYVAQMQGQVSRGVDRARLSLEMTERVAASAADDHALADTKALADLRQQFDDERKALVVARDELEAKYRDASEKAAALERQAADAAAALEKERTETKAREAEAERLRTAIEARVQDLSQRFATMAKERLMNSHRPGEESTAPAAAVLQEIESAKGELAKERKFLQRRAIEMLDREEKVRGREMALGEREATLTKREQEIAGRESALERTKVVAPVLALPPAEVEEAKKDIEMRVKIIQQKALELLDREERLRKRAAELEALEARLSGSVPAR